MTAKSQEKTSQTEKPQGAESDRAEAEVAEETLDSVVGGVARRHGRLS